MMALTPTIEIASIGIPDTLFLMLLALVVFGPRRLPEIGRQIGKLMYEFRKISNDFKYQMEEELRATEEAERLTKLQTIAPPSTLVAPVYPVVEAAPALELGAGNEAGESSPEKSASEPEQPAPAVAGEVRAEPRKFPHIQPPVSGEVIAAQKPFRGRVPEVGEQSEAVPEPAADAADVQAGVIAGSATEQEAHHA